MLGFYQSRAQQISTPGWQFSRTPNLSSNNYSFSFITYNLIFVVGNGGFTLLQPASSGDSPSNARG